MSELHIGHDHRCKDFLERLSRYLDGDLSGADRRTIEEHLHDCPCCEEVLDSLRHTVTICHEEGQPELPDDVRQRAMARVVELLDRPVSRRSRARHPSTQSR